MDSWILGPSKVAWATRRTSVREHRFAAVKAALRKQSLTHEPYSNQVATKLWQILQHRKAEHGNTRVFRKELQHELTEALAPERHSNIMSKNKINKIFQVDMLRLSTTVA
jgi:hypothetical protein